MDKEKRLKVVLLAAPILIVPILVFLAVMVKAETPQNINNNTQSQINTAIPQNTDQKTGANQLDAFFASEMSARENLDEQIDSYNFRATADKQEELNLPELDQDISTIEASRNTFSDISTIPSIEENKPIQPQSQHQAINTLSQRNHKAVVVEEEVNSSIEDQIDLETEKRKKQRHENLRKMGIDVPIKEEPQELFIDEQTHQIAPEATQLISKSEGTKGKRSRKGNAFFSNSEENLLGNLTPAVIHGDQEIVNGSVVKMRLLKSIMLENGVQIPKNHYIFGIAQVNGERVNIQIQNITIDNNNYAYAKKIIDNTGVEGIFIPRINNAQDLNNAGVDVIDEVVQVGRSTGVAGRVVGSVIQSGKNMIRKNANAQTIILKSNHKIYLK